MIRVSTTPSAPRLTSPRWATISDRLCSADPAPPVDAGGGGAAPPAPPPAADPPPAGGEKPFYEGFKNEALRTSPSVQTFKTVEDLAHGFVNLEKRFGIDPARRIDLPADPKDAEGMAAVFAKLGKPEKPDGYGFKLDDKASDADKAFVERALPALHAANLTKDQAAGVIGFWQQEAAAAAQRDADALAAQTAETEAGLKKEWGQAYDQRGKEIGAMLVKYGAPGIAQHLEKNGWGNNLEFGRFLGKVLDAMAEPGGGVETGDAAHQAAMTPAQAAAAARKVEAEPGFRDRNHPQHKALVAERTRLLAMAEQTA